MDHMQHLVEEYGNAFQNKIDMIIMNKLKTIRDMANENGDYYLAAMINGITKKTHNNIQSELEEIIQSLRNAGYDITITKPQSNYVFKEWSDGFTVTIPMDQFKVTVTKKMYEV